METGIDRVRAVMAQPEDVDLPEDLRAEAADVGEDLEAARDYHAGQQNPAPRQEGCGQESDDQGLPPEQLCVDLPLNDRGNGQRLIKHFGQDLANIPRVGWFVWDGKRFQADPDEIGIRRRAHEMTALIEREIEHMVLPEAELEILTEAEMAQEELDQLGVIPSKDRKDDQILEIIRLQKLVQAAKDIKDRRDKSIGRRLTHAKNAGNTNSIKNMITEAGVQIARPLEDMDKDPLVINTLGGVLRFRTEPGEDDGGQYAPPPVVIVDRFDHHQDQLLTKIMPVGLDPQAKCPRFLAFLERVQPSKEMRAFLQRWFGYSMTALTLEQVFAFFYGSGANGKSVLVDLMANIFGDYAASAKIESITGRNRRGGGDATPDLMPLVAARFVRTSEPDQGQQLQEGLIKELTGGEPIMVRSLNENFLTVYPFFKLTMSGNHRPEIRGGDDGIWRRVMLVPFEVQIPKEERDLDLGKKLLEERDGIFNWLVAGLREYLAHGLQIPDQVLAATAEYREDSDPLATFLGQICAVTGNPEHSMRAKDLQEAFAFWLDESGRGAWKPRTIFNSLSAKQGKWRSPSTGQRFSRRKSSDAYYDGVALLEPFRSRFEAHQSNVAMRDARRQADGLF